MDSESRKQRDAFLARFKPVDDRNFLRQMKEEELPNGDVLEWYTWTDTKAKMTRAFIIQVYGHGNGIEVYTARMDNTMDEAFYSIICPDVPYLADAGRIYCVRGPFCFGFGASPHAAYTRALSELPSFVKQQASKDKPIRWQCFQAEPGTDMTMDTLAGTLSWNNRNGARECNELLEGIVSGKHFVIGGA